MNSLKENLALWRQAVIDDENGIERTLISLAWHHAVFLSTAKAVELAPNGANGRKQLNPYLLELISTSYWGSVVMAIRRLVDPGRLEGTKGVSSLRSVLRSVRENRTSITRHAYVEIIAGLEYDADAVEARYWDYLVRNSESGGQAVWIPSELHVEPIRGRHEQFDFLSGKTPQTRSEDDLIREDIFDKFEARLKVVDVIAEQGTIYFAHAATKESRGSRGIDSFGTTQAREALRVLVETTELVSRWFLYHSLHSVMPTAQDDPFQHLDKPLLQTEGIEPLRREWERYSAEVEGWSSLSDTSI